MQKFMIFISRTVLALGVLIALTPCSICKAPAGGSPVMTHCSMASMGGHGCCHTKKTDPFCKVMDQSSTTSPAASLDIPALGLSVSILAPSPVKLAALVPPAVPLDSSPPRSPLILRI